MNVDPDGVREAARGWAIRLRDPAFADWDAFTAWLEASSYNNAAYEAALEDLDAADALFDLPPQPAWTPATTSRPSGQPWRAPAAAAGVALLAVAGGWVALDRDDAAVYATGPGERRALTLADGSRVMLNGGTRITVDRGKPRRIAMSGGEALFQVHHDAARPFVVTTSDGTRLVDAGTTFNVVENGGALDVSVAEGAVLYQGGGAAVRLDAGDMLTRSGAGASAAKRRVDAATVGTWRTGYLHFADAPLADVARTLSRNLGLTITVDPALSSARFAGSVMLDGGHDAVLARVGPLLGVAVERHGDDWRMVPLDGARP